MMQGKTGQGVARNLNKAFLIAFVFGLSACAAFSTKYAYSPNSPEEETATINKWAKIYSKKPPIHSLAAGEPDEIVSILLLKINDKFTETGIKSVIGHGKDTRSTLFPGKQKISLLAEVSGANSVNFDLILDAKPGEIYRLGAATYPEANNYNIWIQNSRGVHVVGARLTVNDRVGTVLPYGPPL